MMVLPSRLQLIIGYLRMQFTIASKNIGVKVIFSPYFFSNGILAFSRHFTMLVTSHSVKLVTCGDVALLRTIWSAISLRMRSISISSTLPPTTAGAGEEVAGAGAAAVGAAAGAAAGACCAGAPVPRLAT